MSHRSPGARRRYLRRKALGKCTSGSCEKKAIKGETLCNYHRKTHRQSSAKYRDKRKNKKILHHCTLKRNIKDILKEGLLIKKPFQRNKLKGIYLSKQPFKWMWNTTCMGGIEGAILTINATGLKLKKDYHRDSRDKELNPEGDYICMENIAPERIEDIFVQDKQGTFKKCPCLK